MKFIKKRKLWTKLMIAPLALSTLTTVVACGESSTAQPTKNPITINKTLTKLFNNIYQDFGSWQIKQLVSSQKTFAYYLSDSVGNTQYNFQQMRYYALTMFGFSYDGNTSKQSALATAFKTAIVGNSNLNQASFNYGPWNNKKAEFQSLMVNTVWNYCYTLFMLAFCFVIEKSATASATASIPFTHGDAIWASYLELCSSYSGLKINVSKEHYTIDTDDIGNLNQQINIVYSNSDTATGAIKDILLNNSNLDLKTNGKAKITFDNLTANNVYCPVSTEFGGTDSAQPTKFNSYNLNFSIDFGWTKNNKVINFLNKIKNDDRVNTALLTPTNYLKLVSLITNIY